MVFIYQNSSYNFIFDGIKLENGHVPEPVARDPILQSACSYCFTSMLFSNSYKGMDSRSRTGGEKITHRRARRKGRLLA